MGYTGITIGVLCGAGGEGAPAIRSNAGDLPATTVFPMLSFTSEDRAIDLILTITGSDPSAIVFLDALIAEAIAVKRGLSLRPNPDRSMREVVQEPVRMVLERAPVCVNCAAPALDHNNSDAYCPDGSGRKYRAKERHLAAVSESELAAGADGDPGEIDEPPLHDAIQLVGEKIPTHYQGAYPKWCPECALRPVAP